MPKIHDIPEFVLASYVMFLLGFLFQFIGFVSPGWYSYSQYGNTTVYGGLWKSCNDNTGCTNVLDADVASYMEATQTFDTFGFLTLLVTAAIFTTKVYKYKNKTDKISWIIIILLFVSSFFVMLAFLIFASASPIKIQLNVGYGFGMTIVAAVFLVVSGNLFVLDATK